MLRTLPIQAIPTTQNSAVRKSGLQEKFSHSRVISQPVVLSRHSRDHPDRSISAVNIFRRQSCSLRRKHAVHTCTTTNSRFLAAEQDETTSVSHNSATASPASNTMPQSVPTMLMEHPQLTGMPQHLWLGRSIVPFNMNSESPSSRMPQTLSAEKLPAQTHAC